jgi:hypothetical protein
MEDKEMEDEEKITPRESGKGMLDFSNSPSMEVARLDREIHEGKQAEIHRQHQREMENIKKFGPLSRGEEEVLGGEEKEIGRLFDREDYEGVKTLMRSKVESLGGDSGDLQVIEYFNKFLTSHDPVIREGVFQMSLLYNKLLKQIGSGSL